MPVEDGHGGTQIGEDDDDLDHLEPTRTNDDKKPLRQQQQLAINDRSSSPFPGSGEVVRTPLRETPPNNIELPRRAAEESNGGMGRNAKEDEMEHENAFTHPAAKTDQQIIWLPRDSLGLGEEAVGQLRRMKIRASYHDALVTEKVRSRFSFLYIFVGRGG